MNPTPKPSKTYDLHAMSVAQRACVGANLVVDTILPDNAEVRAKYKANPRLRRQYRVEQWDGSRGRPKLNGGSAVYQASQRTGASTADIDRALVVKRRDPTLFNAVEVGLLTLHQAYLKVRVKRAPKPLTETNRYVTMAAVRYSVQCGQRRCPSLRDLKYMKREQFAEMDIKLFQQTFQKARDVHDKQGDAALDLMVEFL